MKRWTRIAPVLLVAAVGIGLLSRPALRGAQGALSLEQGRQSPLSQFSSNYQLIGTIYNEILRSYYQDVDAREVAVAGLKGMMRELDPYSDFYVEEQDEGQVADLEITTQGKYSGIGSTIGRQGDSLAIIAPMKGSPAERTGLQAGDRIIRIDGQPSRHFSTSKAASLIKGPEGTTVDLLIERDGIPDPLEFTITRETIEVNDVSAAAFAAPGIAYIEIGRFTKNTGHFLVEAIDELERKQEVEGIVLDLRGNPGGLLDEALAVAEPFLPGGEKVVYTRGRIRGMDQDLFTEEPQRFAGRMVVLVNQASASASEIVAGAMQDLDRAVVVGKTTFGKGLVQTVAPLRDNAFLRLTTGEYFTPSGRSLQRPFVEDDMGHLTVANPSAPDTTEHPTFKSRGGRTLTGGGGVVPDIEADGITGNVLLFDLKFRRGMFLRYVNHYVNTRGLAEGAEVRVDDDLLDDFRDWVGAEGFTFETPTEMRLDDLRGTARAEGVSGTLEEGIAALEAGIAEAKDRMWTESHEKIRNELQREFVTRLAGYEAGQLTYMEHDPQFQAALQVIAEPRRYADILSGTARGQGEDEDR